MECVVFMLAKLERCVGCLACHFCYSCATPSQHKAGIIALERIRLVFISLDRETYQCPLKDRWNYSTRLNYAASYKPK
jgi:hypothetical protein